MTFGLEAGSLLGDELSCRPCDYETSRTASMTRHLKSKAHRETFGIEGGAP